jgi:Protein of unknown function (DUF3105)
MASRQEEKEARRQERLEQEARERKSSARAKRLQYVVGGVLALGIVAAVVIALVASGGGDSPSPSGTTASSELPAPKILDEEQAAKAANCDVTQNPDEGRGHEEKDFTQADYDANPPTSGTHFPTWAQDGIYEPANTPPLGQTVHTLEHGRIDVQYKPGTDPALVKKLEAFLGENKGYHMLLFQNSTKMEPQIAATAWNFVLTCDTPSPQMWDALRTFRDAHLDRGPEKVA